MFLMSRIEIELGFNDVQEERKKRNKKKEKKKKKARPNL
jgi:hypothetical protein